MRLITAALVLLAGLARAQDAEVVPAYDGSTVVATVNGKVITLGHMIMLRSKLPGEYQNLPDETLFPGILDQLIDQELLGAEELAEAGGVPYQVQLAVENEQRALLASNRINKIASVAITEDQIQAAYLEAYGELQPAEEFHAAHILVETEDEAKALIAELEGGADFGTLAEDHSSDTSAANGGDLGWFGLGMMVKPFEDAVVATEPGQWSAPVQSQFGWHVVKVIEKRQKPLPTIDEVRAELIAGLQQKILEDKLTALRAAGVIERPADAVPLSAIRESDLVLTQDP